MPTKQEIKIGDCRELTKQLPDNSIDCVVTSPPYFHMRNYKTQPLIYGGLPDCQHEWDNQIVKGTSGGTNSKVVLKKGVTGFQITPDTNYSICKRCNAFLGDFGWEPTPEMFIDHLVQVFESIRPKLKPTGSLWINLGDKWIDGDLQLIPEQFALAMKTKKWILINKCCWIKPNAMPESVKRRLSKTSELVFHFVKDYDKYWYDLDSIRRPFTQSSINRFTQPNIMNQKGGLKQDELRGKPENGNASRCNKMVQQLAKNYTGKFDGMKAECEQYGSPRARTQRRVAEYQGKYEVENQINDMSQRRNQERADGNPHDHTLDHPLGANPGDTWVVNTSPFSEAHFATFPLQLVKIPILATCPQYICKKCGKPRERIHQAIGRIQQHWALGTQKKLQEATGIHNESSTLFSGFQNVYKQVGYSDCGCGALFEAGTVLDPFAGSGTVLEFCRLNGRNAIGFELNPEYEKLITKRAMLDQPQIQLRLRNTQVI